MSSRVPPSAVGIMLLGMACIPLGDTAGKLLITLFEVQTGFVAWSRFALGLAIALLVLRRVPPASLFMDWRIWLRGALISAAILSILNALKTEPIASVFGAFFIGPVISYVLSVWFLREPFAKSRFLLVLAGFGGVLLVVQPGADMSFRLLFALLAGAFYGAFLVASKWLAPKTAAPHLVITQLLIGTVLLAPFGVPNIPPFTAEIAGLTALSAGFSALGNLLLIVAYRRASATALAPFVYFQLVVATALGIFVFNTIPDTITWMGLLVLVLAGTVAGLVKR